MPSFTIQYQIKVLNSTNVQQNYSLYLDHPPNVSSNKATVGANMAYVGPGDTATFTMARSFYAICTSSLDKGMAITQIDSTPVSLGLQNPATNASIANVTIDTNGYPKLWLAQPAGTPADPPGGFLIKTSAFDPSLNTRKLQVGLGAMNKTPGGLWMIQPLTLQEVKPNQTVTVNPSMKFYLDDEKFSAGSMINVDAEQKYCLIDFTGNKFVTCNVKHTAPGQFNCEFSNS